MSLKPRFVCLLAGPVVAGLLVGCNDDGRALAPAPTVPVAPETTTTSQPAAPEPGFTSEAGIGLSSPSFGDGEVLPADFTCDGLNVPPPLVISGVPETAAELAITVVDRDAGGSVHWVVAGLAPTVTSLEAGAVPPDAVTARTSSGIDGWDGPCPPEGDDPHEYVFTVYAMAEPVGMSAGLDGRDAIALLEAGVIARHELVTRYGRA